MWARDHCGMNWAHLGDARTNSAGARDAGKARRVLAPALIGRQLKAAELVEELSTLAIRLANHETARLAAKLVDYQGDGYAWVAELLAGTAADRERGARAIGVARADLLGAAFSRFPVGCRSPCAA